MRNFIDLKAYMWFFSLILAWVIQYLSVDSLSIIDAATFNNVENFMGYNLSAAGYHIIVSVPVCVFLIPSFVKLISKSEKFTKRSIYIMTVFSTMGFIGNVSSLSNHNSELFGVLNYVFIISLFVLFLIKKLDEGFTFKDVNNILSQNKKETTIEEKNQNLKDKPTNITSLSDDLTKLGELKEKGLLTEEEFNEQKKKLLKK